MTMKRFSILMSASFLVLLLVMASFLGLVTTRMRATGEQIIQSTQSLLASEELQIHLLNYNREEFLFGLTKNKVHDARRAEERDAIDRWLSEAKKHIGSEEERVLYSEARGAIQSYLIKREQLSRTRPPLDAYTLVSEDLEAAYSRADRLSEINVQQAEILSARLRADDVLANWMAALMALVSFGAFPVSWFFMRRSIYRPVRELHHSIVSFSEGESRKVKESGFEEIRKICISFNELSERLAEQKKSQLRFLAAVAHDLRNPLGAIKMSSQLLVEEEYSQEEATPLIQIIARQAEQLDRMVGDLLDSTRIESGQLEIQPSPQNLVTLVGDSAGLYRSVSQIHRIEVTSQSSEVLCNCDPTRMGQVFNNLISNAIKYSPNGGMVRIRLSVQADEAVVSISDEGIGLSEDDQQIIFEPFRRTALTKMSIPGVGLGLSVVKRIVSAHHGKIEIMSVPNQGATFTIRLPRWSKEFEIQQDRRFGP